MKNEIKSKGDLLTARHTAFPSFLAMLNAAGNYFPSIYCRTGGPMNNPVKLSARSRRSELTELADAYDAAQAARGDGRRAFRA